jgi:hypothetical protein
MCQKTPQRHQVNMLVDRSTKAEGQNSKKSILLEYKAV